MTTSANWCGGFVMTSLEVTNSVNSVYQPYISSTLRLCGSITRLNDDRTTPSQSVQKKLRFVVKHIAFRLFGLLLILVDIGIVIIDLTSVATDSQIDTELDWVAFSIMCYFILEINLRLLALGPREFAQSWYNLVDYVIVVFTFGVAIISLSLSGERYSDFAKLLVVGRLFRIAVFIRLFTEKKQLETGVRNLVSQNKRRYVKDGFDLDLTYVTDSIIAMSFPSSGKMAMYRNPIKEVARFLDKYHLDNYKVYNLCSEKSYDESHFHGRVERFPFDDHNPPPLAEMFKFTSNIKEWLAVNSEHVVAIHCKGGKGRTGTMVSALLIESGKFDSTKDCLGYFGSRRTDLELGDKYQGVETPSQNRYVTYYGQIKKTIKDSTQLTKSLQLNKLEIFSIKNIGKGDGSDLIMQIQDADKHCILWTEFERDDPKRAIKCEEENVVVLFKDGPVLRFDVKVIFHTTNSDNSRRKKKDVFFFFWFHVAFIEDLKLSLNRNEIDNAHKEKEWKIFGDKFRVELTFNEITDL